MKVLYATLGYPPKDESGASALCYEMTQRLADNGVEVHVLVPGDNSQSLHKKCNLYVHWQKVSNKAFLGPFSIPIQVLTNGLLLHKSALEIIERYDIDLICSMDYAGYYIAGKVPTITFDMHPTIYDYVLTHSLIQKFYVLLFTSIMERIVIQKSEKIVCSGHNSKRLLEWLYPFAKEKMIVIGYGIDTNKFRYIENSTVRHDYDVSDEDILLLHHGGARSERKGTLDLLEALKNLRGYKIKCMLTGESREAGWKRRLLGKIKEGKLDNIILTGEVPYEESPSFYSSADIVVFPSLFEGYGLPPLEAMACEKPVITTKVGELPYLIRNNKNGILIDTRDVETLTSNVKKLIADPELRRRLGREGRAYIKENLNWGKKIEEMIHLFCSIISENQKNSLA